MAHTTEPIKKSLVICAFACAVPAGYSQADAMEIASAPRQEFDVSIDQNETVDLVVVGSGEFHMGSPDGEPGRVKREGPQQRVKFSKPFALSRTEITVAQFRKFVEDTGYVTSAEESGKSTIFDTESGKMIEKKGVSWRKDFRGRTAKGNLPVIHISWSDAKAFADWLSGKAGARYRLPSESEFEYALRAGTETRYWWGNSAPERRVENLSGSRERLADLRWPVAFKNYTDSHWGPSPVASFEANPFGLFDMGGNAAEWVEDCFTEELSDIPDNGSPSKLGNCQMRVFRGGAWAYPPPLSRSAYRNAGNETFTSALVGFRVARDI